MFSIWHVHVHKVAREEAGEQDDEGEKAKSINCSRVGWQTHYINDGA